MIDFVTSQVKPGAGLAATLATYFAAPNCTVDSTDLSCKLARFLPVLYVVAVVLAIALVVVIGIAIHAWRKTRETEIVRR